MNHAEVVIARRAVEEGRGLVVIVNKMDLLKGKLHENVVKAVPEEVQTVLPQVCWFKTFKGRYALHSWALIICTSPRGQLFFVNEFTKHCPSGIG